MEKYIKPVMELVELDLSESILGLETSNPALIDDYNFVEGEYD